MEDTQLPFKMASWNVIVVEEKGAGQLGYGAMGREVITNLGYNKGTKTVERVKTHRDAKWGKKSKC